MLAKSTFLIILSELSFSLNIENLSILRPARQYAPIFSFLKWLSDFKHATLGAVKDSLIKSFPYSFFFLE